MLRRGALAITLIAILAIMMGCKDAPVNQSAFAQHPAIDAYSGWRLGVQAYTFNRFTLFEAIDKAASAGLDWIEFYSDQRFSDDNIDPQLLHTRSADDIAKVKAKLVSSGIRAIAYGVVGLPNDEAESRKVFEFAKVMGIRTIVSEPEADALDLVEKLCEEYEIQVALHNHPKPSIYWNPETVAAALEGRSELMGACADTGHWMRSGIRPLDALKILEGRIIHSHFKDLNEFGNPDAHDVVFGTGAADVEAVLVELHRQGYQGAFSIEFEHNWDNNLPDVRASANFFNNIAATLNPTGWKNVFADDLSNAIVNEGSWTVEEGELTRHGGGYIWTEERYGNFILDLEYKVSDDANSGVFFRTGSIDAFVQTAIEVQIHNTTDGTKYGSNGSIYDVMGPSKPSPVEAGVWHHFTITALDNRIWVVLNGEQIIDMDLDNWTEAHMNPDGTKNKFNTPYKDMPREGHIGLQDHGQPVWFRNIKIKSLEQ